ncbi:unnamed protein product, partial [Gongylonema pulchrum]|uniref:Glycosyltransferase family 1 protein n=1 Tax=Gongylonema pulchrum TaxID=637853 RepID=A0A183EFI4_9BILA
IKDYYPWEDVSVDKQLVKRAYENTIVITAHGYDHKFIQEFQQKFAKETGHLASQVYLNGIRSAELFYTVPLKHAGTLQILRNDLFERPYGII